MRNRIQKRTREPKPPTTPAPIAIPLTAADLVGVDEAQNEAVKAHAKRDARVIRYHLFRGMSVSRLESIYGKAAVRLARVLISR